VRHLGHLPRTTLRRHDVRLLNVVNLLLFCYLRTFSVAAVIHYSVSRKLLNDY
jgi:hypothetical protein